MTRIIRIAMLSSVRKSMSGPLFFRKFVSRKSSVPQALRCVTQSRVRSRLTSMRISLFAQELELALMKTPTRHEVLAQARTILQSQRFARITKGKKLFRYLVRETLKDAQRSPRIKGVTIAIEVYGKTASFDPKKNATVKVAIRDLRKALGDYNKSEGRDDRVVINIPAGSNVPQFRFSKTAISLDLDNRDLVRVSWIRRGMDLRDAGGFMSAEFMLTDAMKEHPDHPRVLSLAAMLYAVRAGSAPIGSPRTELEEAESILRRIPIEESAPWEGTLTAAWLSATLHWDWQRAANLFDRAVRTSSGEAYTYHSWYPFFLASQLQIEEAEAIMKDAVSRAAYDSNVTAANLALLQIIAGKLDEAEDTLSPVMAAPKELRYSSIPTGYGQTALLHAARGDFERAAEVLNPFTNTYRPSLSEGLQGLFWGLAGNRAKARTRYKEMVTRWISDCSLSLAVAASGAGDDDTAVKWLTKAAVRERDPLMILIGVLPITRHLHNHSGFRTLVTQRMKLPFPD